MVKSKCSISTWSFTPLSPTWEVKMPVRGEAAAQQGSAGTRFGSRDSTACLLGERVAGVGQGQLQGSGVLGNRGVTPETRVLEEEEDRAINLCVPIKDSAASWLPPRGQGRRLSLSCYFWYLLLCSSLWGAAGAGSRRQGAWGKTGSAARGTLPPCPDCLAGPTGAGGDAIAGAFPVLLGSQGERWPGPSALGVSPELSTARSCLGCRPLAPSQRLPGFLGACRAEG